MISCNVLKEKLIILKDRLADKPTSNNTKWDRTQITDDILVNLLNKDTFDNAVSELDSIIKSPLNKKKTVNQLNSEELTTATSYLFKDNESNVRGLSIAFDTLLSTIKSNYDIAIKNNFKASDLNKVKDSNGIMNISLSNLQQIVGRQILESMMLKVGKDAPENRANYEANIGKMYTDMLEEAGIITVTDGSYPYNKQRQADGKFPEKHFQKKTLEDKVVSINLEHFNINAKQVDGIVKALHKGAIGNGTVNNPLNDSARVSKVMGRLFFPSDTIVPEKDTSDVDLDYSKAKGAYLTQTRQELYKDLNEGARFVHSDFVEIFEGLSQEGKDTSVVIDEMFSSIGTDETLRGLFGMGSTKFEEFNVDTENSVRGKARTKQTNVLSALENSSLFVQNGKALPLHYEYYSFRTDRSLAKQNTLNPQTDKFFSRAVTGGGKTEIDVMDTTGDYTEEFKLVLGMLVEDYGVSRENIASIIRYGNNPKENTLPKDLDAFIKAFRSDKSNLKSKLMFLSAITEGVVSKNSPLINKYDSAWDAVKAYGVLADLLEVKDNKFTTEHDVAPDASASGLQLNMLQALSTKNKDKVTEVLKDMGMIENEEGNYEVTIDSLYNYVANELTSGEDLGILNAVDNTKQELDFIMTVTNISLRNLAKYPTMTIGAYGQGKSTGAFSIAKDLAEKVYESMSGKNVTEEQFQIFKDKLLKGAELNYDTNGDFVEKVSKAKNMSDIQKIEGNRKALVSYYANTLGKNLADITTNKVKNDLFGGSNELVTELFDSIIKKIDGDFTKLKVLPPETYIEEVDGKNLTDEQLAKLIQKKGLPLTKRVEVITENGLTIQKEVENLPSALVSITHMIDAAIQHMALAKSMKEYKKLYGKTPGVMPIHDAVNSDPRFAVINNKNYINMIFDVNSKYDKVDTLLMTAKALGVDANVIAKVEGSLDIKAKQTALSSMKRNANRMSKAGTKLFGYNTSSISAAGLNPVHNFINANDTINLNPQYTKMFNKVTEFFADNNTVLLKDNAEYSFSKPKDSKGVITANYSDPVGKKIKYLYHEVVHAKTAMYINENMESNDVQYLLNSIPKLNDIREKLTNKAKNRLDYILSQNSREAQVAELVAILEAEPEVAQSIYSALAKKDNNMFEKLYDFVKNVIDIVRFTITKENLDSLEKNGIDVDLLFGALANVVNNDRSLKATDEVQKLGAGIGSSAKQYFEYVGSNKLNDPVTGAIQSVNDYAKSIIVNSIETYGEKLYDSFLETKHKELLRAYPAYKETMAFLDKTRNNETVQQMKHYLLLDKFKDAIKKNDFLSMYKNYEQERNKIDSTFIRKLDDKLQKEFSEKEIYRLNNIYSKIGLASLVDNEDILAKILADEITLEQAIKDLEKSMTKFDKDLAYSLNEMNLNGHTNGATMDNPYNYLAEIKADAVTKLSALYGLRDTNGIATIKDVNKRLPEAHTEMILVGKSIRETTNKLLERTGNKAPIRGTFNMDIYDHNYQIIPVTLEDFNKGKYAKENDWETLRTPTKDTVGILYRRVDLSDQQGIGVNNNFKIDGVMLSDDMSKKYKNLKANNAVNTVVGAKSTTKIVLTVKEKMKLGVNTSPAHTLYRTYSHNKFLLDTQDIRDTLVTDNYTKTIKNKEDANKLLESIKDENTEHSWFLKIDKDIPFNKLPKEVQNKYRPVTSVTSLGNMKGKVTHVRKDIKPWLEGYKDIEVFKHSPFLNKASMVLRKLLILQKIHWIIVNPAKVATDFISNYSYLLTRNVPITKLYKYSKDAMADVASLSELRAEYIMAKMELAMDEENESKKKKLAKLENDLKNHKINFAHFNGYIQSLSTDIVLKDFDTVTGLQSDLEDIVNKAIRTRKGDLNVIGRYVKSFMKAGVSTEDGLRVLAGVLNKHKTSKGMASVLDSMSEELTNMRNKEDVAKYILQFVASPGSEVTKLGSAMVQASDVIPRIVLHKHLKDIGYTEEEAVKEVIESFPDYKVNMPPVMKAASDYGILLFPAFWMRIQKIIVQLGRKHPISLATAFTLSELLGVQNTHIMGSNVFNKWENGSILNSPEITIDAFLPTDLLP